MRITTVLAACSVLFATSAHADEVTYSGERAGPESGFGFSFLFGGGVVGFTERTMQDTVNARVESAWSVRVALRTHRALAVEVGMLGTISNIDAVNGSQSGTLYGTAIEATGRYNVLPDQAWTPFGFVGLGWQRYSVLHADMNLVNQGVNNTDHAVVLPIGAGLAYRARNGFVFELRGSFRLNADPGLALEEMGSTDYAPMHTWETSAAFGYEF